MIWTVIGVAAAGMAGLWIGVALAGAKREDGDRAQYNAGFAQGHLVGHTKGYQEGQLAGGAMAAQLLDEGDNGDRLAAWGGGYPRVEEVSA